MSLQGRVGRPWRREHLPVGSGSPLGRDEERASLLGSSDLWGGQSRKLSVSGSETSLIPGRAHSQRAGVG